MFGPAAIARQQVDGSYTAYGSQTERPDDGPMPLDDREKAMIRALDQFQIATVTESGWPYIQYRSGPKGFLQVLDNHTLGFADFAGNHQYVTAANLDHDDRVAIFLPRELPSAATTQALRTGTYDRGRGRSRTTGATQKDR